MREAHIPLDVLLKAQEYYDEHGEALLRESQVGETMFFVGQSFRQEVPVLLDDDLEDEPESVCLAAFRAYRALYDQIPLRFVAENQVVAEISTHFTDRYSDASYELTFDKEWVATLLQYWCDAEWKGICFQRVGKAKARPWRWARNDRVVSPVLASWIATRCSRTSAQTPAHAARTSQRRSSPT